MRRLALVVWALAVLAFVPLRAQAPSPPRRSAPLENAAPLPVRKVVLYKNGIGYFEHVGRIHGTQTVTVDFNSNQLNDVLKTLTTIDLGNGQISGVSYNSEASLSQRLTDLRLPLGDRPTLAQLLDALRGARLEVRAGARTVTGRLLGVEKRVFGRGENAVTREELTIVSDAGEIDTIELTPGVGLRMAEHDTAEQIGSYLGLISSTRAQDRRRMTITSAGTGDRDLLVSYISEVPIWKATYRVVLPQTPSDKPLLQGWAIVDNTIGTDWENVELSLVAGAPQSFVQQLSQPLYAQRPVVPLPRAALLMPQTHASALTDATGAVAGDVVDPTGAVLPGVTVRVLDARRSVVASATTDAQGHYSIRGLTPGRYAVEFALPGFNGELHDAVVVGVGTESDENAVLGRGAVGETVTLNSETPDARAKRGVPAGAGGGSGGGRYRPGVEGGLTGGVVAGRPESPAAQAAPVRIDELKAAADARDLGDLFEYRLTRPISIKRNQSALVPILATPVTAERVSVWNGATGARPLRGVWLTNTSGLTLDAGSFTVLDGGAFAGEGMIEPLKPAEKRLLSYAVDLGVRVDSRVGGETGAISRLTIAHGVVIERVEQRSRRTYTLRNDDESDRLVVIEHPIRPGWTIASAVKPAETTAAAYRFAVPVSAKTTATLVVDERRPTENRYAVSEFAGRLDVVVMGAVDGEALRRAFAPVFTKKAALAAIDADAAGRKSELDRIAQDQERVRENMKSLKGTREEQQLLRRYATDLNEQEDHIVALKKALDDLGQKRMAAQTDLNAAIDALTLEVAMK